jgi:hypothetical protein
MSDSTREYIQAKLAALDATIAACSTDRPASDGARLQTALADLYRLRAMLDADQNN